MTRVDSQPAVLPPRTLDLTLLRELCGEELLVRAVLETFLAEVPRHVAELSRAIAARDAEAVWRAAHTLKGAFAQLGASDLASAFRRIEACGRAGDAARAGALWRWAAPAVDLAWRSAHAVVEQGA